MCGSILILNSSPFVSCPQIPDKLHRQKSITNSKEEIDKFLSCGVEDNSICSFHWSNFRLYLTRIFIPREVGQLWGNKMPLWRLCGHGSLIIKILNNPPRRTQRRWRRQCDVLPLKVPLRVPPSPTSYPLGSVHRNGRIGPLYVF